MWIKTLLFVGLVSFCSGRLLRDEKHLKNMESLLWFLGEDYNNIK